MTHLAAALAGALVALGIHATLVVAFVKRTARRHAAELSAASRRRTDVAACRALRDAGVDPATPTELSFYLYFATLHAAERAGAQVAALRVDAPNLAVRIERAARGASYLCRVSMHAAPSECAIRATCEQLRAVAVEYGGALGGWEVAVTP
jgi:hypothetical protein